MFIYIISDCNCCSSNLSQRVSEERIIYVIQIYFLTIVCIAYVKRSCQERDVPANRAEYRQS